MKSIRNTLIAASLLVGLAGLTLAQTAPEAKADGSCAERIDQMQAHKVLRDAEMQKHRDVTKTFNADLNASQKKVLDTETARAMPSMGGGMCHSEGGHHGHH